MILFRNLLFPNEPKEVRFCRLMEMAGLPVSEASYQKAMMADSRYMPKKVSKANSNRIEQGKWVDAKSNRHIHRFVTRVVDMKYFEDDGVVSGQAPSSFCEIANYVVSKNQGK